MNITKKGDIPAPACSTTTGNYAARLSEEGFLQFKKATCALIIATHKLTHEQSITLAEYAATLSEQGITDEWVGWLTDNIEEIRDNQDRQ